MNTWSKRIKQRMAELNLTQEMLAKKMGMTRGAITHYLSGLRQPPLVKFQKLAAVLKTDPAWLQFGTVTKSAVVEKDEIKNKKKSESKYYPIPILSWHQAAEFIDVTKIDTAELKNFVPNYFTDKPKWFALKVEGDSMSNASGNGRSFRTGSIIIVDSEKSVKHGSYVIAVLPRMKEATFKQYVVDGGIKYLKPLNPQYPIVEIKDSTHICGIVVNYLELVD